MADIVIVSPQKQKKDPKRKLQRILVETKTGSTKHEIEANSRKKTKQILNEMNTPKIRTLKSTTGSIQIILGPMFSGKTTELLRLCRRHTIASRKCLLIKYSNDYRYDEQCATTHDQQKNSALPVSRLFEIPEEKLSMVDVIGIDEGQFFPDVVGFCEKWANKGKIVLVAALDGTFERKPFGEILNLIPLAEHVKKLEAICLYCGDNAAFTKRTSQETQVEVIGGKDKYVSVCRTCSFLK